MSVTLPHATDRTGRWVHHHCHPEEAPEESDSSEMLANRVKLCVSGRLVSPVVARQSADAPMMMRRNTGPTRKGTNIIPFGL